VARVLERETAMKFIIKSIRTKPDSSDFDEFTEFCECVLSALEVSAFFSDSPTTMQPNVAPIVVRPRKPPLIELFATICAT
jgi:hypothetical protein